MNVIADSLSIALQASFHRMADQPPFFQADLRSASHSVDRSICDAWQCATSPFSIPLPRREWEGGRGAIPHVGFSGGVVRLSHDSAASSDTREDSSVFTPGSFVSPRMAQAAMVQLPRGAVSSACSPSPPQRFSPHTGEFHSPVLHNVQSSHLDIIRDGYRGHY